MAYPISDVPRRIVYSGSAGVGPYAFTFEVLANTDIAVYKNTTLLTLTTDYTVSINTGTGTGTVTLVVAATGSDTVTIVGDRAIQRTSDFVTGGDLFANTLNDELDAQVIYTQQVDEKADRAIKAPVTDPTTINMTLPASTVRASKALGFNASGNPTQSSSTLAAIDAAVTTVQTLAAASPGSSAGISHIAAGTGAVATTVQAKLRESVSVRDFGAVGDGVTDDTTAIQAAIDSGAAVVTFTQGTYVVSGALNNLSTNQTFIVQGTILVSVSKWLEVNGADYVKVIGQGGEIRFDSIVTDNRAGGIGAGIHITDSSYVEVTGFKVTTLTSDRTKTSFVVGTKSSVGCIVRDNVLTDIGIGVIAGWTDDVSQQDANNIPTSKWAIENNTFNNCGRAAYANIMVRSKSNSYDRTDPYALTAHRVVGNKINGLGGGGASDIAIEYWSNSGTISQNVITGNAVDTYSHIAISCAKAYDLFLSGNKIQGAWNYQAIELATCNSCVIEGNRFYNVTNTNANCAGVGISVANVGDPISTGNVVQGNTFANCKVGVLTGGASTAVPYSTKTIISGNTFEGTTARSIYNFGQATIAIGNTFSGATPVEVLVGSIDIGSNYFTTTSSFCVYVQSTAGVVNVRNNSFVGWGSAGQNAAIFFVSSTPGFVEGNKFASDGRSQSGWTFPMVALVKTTASPAVDTQHFVGVNYYDGVQAQLNANSGTYGPINTAVGRIFSTDNIIAGLPNKVIIASSAPASGTWAVGDRVLNIAPAAGGNIGWVYTAAGWKTFGDIAP